MAVINFQKPDKILMLHASEREATFELAPLEPGYGVTIGNSLRRVLLSALEGFAITAFKLEGVDHEFMTINGVIEDVSEIILNLKQVRFKLTNPALDIKQDKIVFSISGKDRMKAGDIAGAAANFEILNPEFVICHLDKEAQLRLNWELYIEKGRGYVPSEQNYKEDLPVGTIFIDSIYTPITNVKYEVQNYRVEQKTDYEKLKLEVVTDGSIHPKEALKEAATTLIQHLGLFTDEKISVETPAANNGLMDENTLHIRALLKTKLTNMNLSVRAINCLKAAEVETLGQLVSYYKSDLLKFRNFGKKSLDELEKLVKDKDLKFGMDISKYMLDKD